MCYCNLVLPPGMVQYPVPVYYLRIQVSCTGVLCTVSFSWCAKVQTRRFRNFSFYPSIASTGLVCAYDSLKTEKRFKEKRRKKIDRKKKEENWRKKFRAISRLEKIEEI